MKLLRSVLALLLFLCALSSTRVSAFHSIVVTLHGHSSDSACTEATDVFRTASSCSSVIECQENKLLLGVDGCASEVLPPIDTDTMTDERSLVYLRQWVAAKLGGADLKVDSVEPYK